MKNSVSIAKAFVLVLAVVLFAGFLSLPMHLNAASAVQLTVSDASGKAGDVVTISITISPNSTLGAADLLLKYDASKLMYKEHKIGLAADGGLSSVNPNYKIEGNFTTIYHAYINMYGLAAGGSMLDVTFTIKSGWSGETPLALTVKGLNDASSQYKEIEHNIKNGKISIGTATTTNPGVTTTTNLGVSTTTKPGVPATTNPGVPTTKVGVTTTTTKPTTTRVENVTDKDGLTVTEINEAGSAVNKTTVIYDMVTKVENVTDKDGVKVTEKDEAGSTVYKTTVIYEKVVGSEYVTQEGGSKVFETDEAGSTVYKTTLIYETVDSADLEDETEDIAVGSMSTAKKTVIIITLVCVILVAAVLIAFKKKKDTAD